MTFSYHLYLFAFSESKVYELRWPFPTVIDLYIPVWTPIKNYIR